MILNIIILKVYRYWWARGYIIVQNTHYDYGDIMNIISFEGGRYVSSVYEF